MQENKSLAMFRLRLALATEHRSAVPIGTIGTERWRARVRRPRRTPGDLGAPLGRLEINPKHKDFPALLAEALERGHAFVPVLVDVTARLAREARDRDWI
jgi:hypothetical protein